MSIEAELAAEIVAYGEGDPAPAFEPWALRIFRHQFEHNPPYRAYCDRRGVDPTTVTTWDAVPPVPTAAFRHTDLACGPAQATFLTSGTTTDGQARGRHLVPHLPLYRTSATVTFVRHVLADDARLPALFLLPDAGTRPESSLVRMCAWVGESFAPTAEWFVGPSGLERERLRERLATAERRGESVLLAGPTAAFADLFATGCRYRLGPASRVMDTGGAKGMDRPLSRNGFLRACWNQLGIAGYYCINEYGMTELCSQRYDSVLLDRQAGNSLAPRRLVGPPWLRTRVLDPETLAPMPAGETGLLCHHDLANAGSVAVVLTEDLGRTIGDDGIELVGRVAGAVPRGCGLLLADLASA